MVWRRKNLKVYIATFVASLLTFSVLSCSIANSQVPSELPRGQTLYVAGMQWGAPSSFNPLAGHIDWPCGGSEEAIYETLFGYNQVTAKLDPILGEKYEWIDPHTLKVTLHKETYWQDALPLTSEDVVYTFKLSKKYSLAYSDFWTYAKDVKALDNRTIEISLNPEKLNRLVIMEELGTIRILPKHVWINVEAKYKNIRQFRNLKPIGSGPYKLLYFSPEKIIIQRDNDYWGIKYFGKPAPKYIVHPIFKSNDAGNIAFEKAQIDMSQQFAPAIWKMWERGLPVGTWYKHPPYHIPGSIPTLYINIHKYPLNLPEVRRALAYSINYKKVAEVAMTKYSATVSPSMLILPLENKYYNEAVVKKYGWRYDPAKSIEILKGLGFKRGSDGIWVTPDGTRLGPYYAECPYGWTDWMTSLEIVAEGARKVGIDVRTRYPEAPVWDERRVTGNFDLLMCWTPNVSPASPWNRFHFLLDSREVAPIGKTAYRNFERYSNPKVNQLLDKIAATSNETELKQLYSKLIEIYLKDIPVISLEYRPWLFYEYNETYWTGFPNEKNPYAPPQLSTQQAGIEILYKIKPKK